MTVIQGKALHQILQQGYNGNRDSPRNVRFYEVRPETMMDEHLSSGTQYNDSRGLPKANIPMGDPSMDHPNTNNECHIWHHGIGT
eukprot:3689235-Karenia_brevis.AAC.1